MTSSAIDSCIALLSDLIGYRTENPGGEELPLCERLADELRARRADAVEIREVARPGKVPGGYVLARYGDPRLIVNVHVDTVPANTGWTRDPFVAEVSEGRLYGLGSADTKGAIAAVLVALEGVRPRDTAILFSGDEENGSLCIKEFVEEFVDGDRIAGLERAIVCEPTGRRAGVRHRGIWGLRAQYRGRGGHSSGADHMPKPIVTLARLAVALDDLGRDYLDRGPEDMKGLCMNVARLDGGIAYNVVPDAAELAFSIRQPPDFDAAAFRAAVDKRISSIDPAITLTPKLAAEPFACGDVAGFREILGDFPADYVPLDFWTEAAVFSAHGVDAVVIGPGDIARAHAPDEFVPVADLEWATAMFRHVFAGTLVPIPKKQIIG